MTIVITGATGQLGRLVVGALLDQNVPPAQIVAGGRDLAKLSDLAELGVLVRRIDYNDPSSLQAAFAGANKVLLISGSEVGQRLPQHRNAIDAAREAGVGLIAYTSVANADTTAMALAAEHQATEQLLKESGVPFVLLRNGWYLENYTAQLDSFVEHGAVIGSAGDGQVSAASRADYAWAAAAVLLQDGQSGKVYELGADEPFTLDELAQAVSQATERQVTYRNLPVEDYTQVLVSAGLPQPYAEILADSDLGIARGDLLVPSRHLSTLIGRPTTSMRDAVLAAARTL